MFFSVVIAGAQLIRFFRADTDVFIADADLFVLLI